MFEVTLPILAPSQHPHLMLRDSAWPDREGSLWLKGWAGSHLAPPLNYRSGFPVRYS